MNHNHKEIVSLGLSIGIIVLTILVIHRFIPSLVWAGVIVIATYPLYCRWRVLFGKYQNLSALLFTTIFALLLIVPLSWFVNLLFTETQFFINYLQVINREGGQAPDLLRSLPLISNDLVNYWNNNIGNPGNVKDLLSNWHMSLTPASYYLKLIGSSLFHRGFQLGFTMLTLFFFYRDGDALFKQIHHIGEKNLGARWFKYADRLPSALRGTVNGTIFVGIGVGILMGVCYELVGFPWPTLMGFLTALAAMIPFVAPVVFVIAAFILLTSSSFIAAIVVLVWGTVVMFVADHFVKPVLIGGAIELPFLAVLLGILGGVETFGLLGLFVGPIIMVLFITLWYESQNGA